MIILHPLEKDILKVLSNGEWNDIESIALNSGLKEDQVRRAIEWLLSKGLIEKREYEEKREVHVKDRPAELKIIEKLKNSGGKMKLDDLKKFFSNEEFTAGFGRAKSLGWVELERDDSLYVYLKEGGDYEKLIDSLAVIESKREISKSDMTYVKELSKRGLVEVKVTKKVGYKITKDGLLALSSQMEDYIDNITAELLSSGEWRGKKLRPIDVVTEPPKIFPGRRHPVKEFIAEVRDVYISMGFTELQGNSIQPAFWNFDALFIPQDHPAREMQDTFYLKDLYDESIRREGVYERVALTHENGWETGSKGWGYKWDVNQARRLLLRTHNTVLTVKALHEYGNKELRVFAISKVYRNENLDYKHLAEFHQMDGIIEGEDLNVKHLVGFLKEFYLKLGIKDIKLWPTYFPYTEPSLQIMGYSDKVKGWIELGGSGIFRPEVTLPLGVKLPVLAWGPAIERLMLLRYNLEDIRELYSNDIGWLRRRVQIARSEGRA
jgi:phenylalanyl-tRNA synthetase alpha chain